MSGGSGGGGVRGSALAARGAPGGGYGGRNGNGSSSHPIALDDDDRLDAVEELNAERQRLELDRARMVAERQRWEQMQAVTQRPAPVSDVRPTSVKSRLTPFSSGDFEVWIRSFKNEAEDHGWTTMLAQYLRKMTDGVAREFVSALDDDVKHDYDRLVAALRTRFGNSNRDMAIKEQIRQLVPRSSTDAPNDVWFRLVELNGRLSATKRYTEETLFEDYFLKLVADDRQPDINIPGSISDKLAASERYHRPVAIWKPRSAAAAATPLGASGTSTARVLAIEAGSTAGEPALPTPVLAVTAGGGASDVVTRSELQQILRTFANDVAARAKSTTTPAPFDGDCLNCGLRGHRWRLCPAPRRPELAAQVAASRRPRTVTQQWTSGQPQHIAPFGWVQQQVGQPLAAPHVVPMQPMMFAPQHQQPSQQQQQQSAPRQPQQGGNVMTVCAGSSHRAMAVVEIGGVQRRALFDSGASTSIVDSSVAEANPSAERRQCTVALDGAFGSTTASDAIRLPVVTLAGVRRFVWFVVVVSFQVNVLIGLDAMKALNVDVLASSNTLRFKPDAGLNLAPIDVAMSVPDQPAFDGRTMAIASVVSQVLPPAAVFAVVDNFAAPSQLGPRPRLSTLLPPLASQVPTAASAADHPKGCGVWGGGTTSGREHEEQGGSTSAYAWEGVGRAHNRVLADESDREWSFITAYSKLASLPSDEHLAAAISSTLSTGQRAQLLAVLQRNRAAFARDSMFPGCTKEALVHNVINTGDNKPIRQRLRKRSEMEDAFIDEQVREMVANGVLVPSDGSEGWASNVHLVKKTDGSMRFTVDYRDINAVTTPDPFPASQEEVAFRHLRECCVFSKMDAKAGFWQIRLDESDSHKTTIVTSSGLYRFTVLPFGPTNAPAAFLRYVLARLRTAVDNGLVVYADDLMQADSSFELHLVSLNSMLAVCAAGGPKLGIKKCQFGEPSIGYLGHTVSAAGISVDPAKVRAIVNLTAPETVGGVRLVLGMFGYYRKFIKDFATLAGPLTALTAFGRPPARRHSTR
jgi:hypothetical protein